MTVMRFGNRGAVFQYLLSMQVEDFEIKRVGFSIALLVDEFIGDFSLIVGCSRGVWRF